MNHRPDPKRSPCVVGLALLAFASTLIAVPLLAQDPEVTSADPAAAEQGTLNLDVTIRGNGFAQGAVARFLVTGTENPGGIIVNSTTRQGPKKLIANIDIATDAEVANFDIEVQSNGRFGKGTELFSVVKGNSGKTEILPATITYRDFTVDGDGNFVAFDNIRSDWGVSYSDGVDEVHAVVGRLLHFHSHSDEPRRLVLTFSDVVDDRPFDLSLIPMSPDSPVFYIVIAPQDCEVGDDASICPDLEGGFRILTPLDGPVPARLVLNFLDDPFTKDSDEFRFRMGPNIVGAGTKFEEIRGVGTHHLVVSCTKVEAVDGSCTEWSVATQDPPNDIGRLIRITQRKKGVKGTSKEVGDFHMPHGLTIEIQQP